jgi:D-glycero-D-manno-heptose 1,7-bisphosphate phosphatase
MKEAQMYIFDKDGTIIAALDGRPANAISEQSLLPNVAEKCADLRNAGKILAIASNQGGVAAGFLSYAAARGLVDHAAILIGAQYIEMCPHMPYGPVAEFVQQCECRKPKPGMLLEIARLAGLAPDECVYVGDWKTDKEAAEAAGMCFEWAADFFEWPKTTLEWS